MKLPARADDLYRIAEFLDERMLQQNPPQREDASAVRALGAAVEVLEKMPMVVCLIGSTRFFQDFADYNFKLTLAGYIVLSIGCDTKKDGDLSFAAGDKERLDALHIWKLILCDEVFCINRDGYIGESTAREIGIARMIGRPITFMVPDRSPRASYDVPPSVAEAVALAAGSEPRARQRRPERGTLGRALDEPR